jgi:hypothetical protein
MPRFNEGPNILTPLLERMLAGKIPAGSELTQLRSLLLHQLVQARALGHALPSTFSLRAGALPVAVPGFNSRLLEANSQ